jgi:hypothetical protein
MKSHLFTLLSVLTSLTVTSHYARAADWSDTSIGVRYGTNFGEPYVGNGITKTILDLNSVSGYAYGVNFFNVDLLMSNYKDPDAPGSTTGAQEAYVVYRNTLDLGKVLDKEFKYGFIRGIGGTAGFDWNTKNDAGYNSKKRMLVIGPTMMLDVPGFLNISALELFESNAPYNDYTQVATPRYEYKPHPDLDITWQIPFNVGIPLTFEGYGDFIASKGKNEFGDDTAAETHFDMQWMYSFTEKKTFRAGFEYEYWKNKFGNDYTGPAGPGAFAKTAMVRMEYHF